jgi:hypothetical protein
VKVSLIRCASGGIFALSHMGCWSRRRSPARPAWGAATKTINANENMFHVHFYPYRSDGDSRPIFSVWRAGVYAPYEQPSLIRYKGLKSNRHGSRHCPDE